MHAPTIAPYPALAPITPAVEMKLELVPMTIGSREPSFHTGYSCSNVAMAATNIAF